jgi:hypothetical protein
VPSCDKLKIEASTYNVLIATEEDVLNLIWLVKGDIK